MKHYSTHKNACQIIRSKTTQYTRSKQMHLNNADHLFITLKLMFPNWIQSINISITTNFQCKPWVSQLDSLFPPQCRRKPYRIQGTGLLQVRCPHNHAGKVVTSTVWRMCQDKKQSDIDCYQCPNMLIILNFFMNPYIQLMNLTLLDWNGNVSKSIKCYDTAKNQWMT